MNRLITLKTYDSVPIAHMAKQALEDVGIVVMLADENLVAMDWLISNAIGGIKLKVAEEDVPRAIQILDELKPDQILPEERLSEDELTRQALEAAVPDEEEPAEEPTPEAVQREIATATTPSGSDDNQPSQRDKDAWKAFVASWLGLGIWLIIPLAIYWTLCACFSAGSISTNGRIRIAVVLCLIVLGLSFAAAFSVPILPYFWMFEPEKQLAAPG